MTSISSSEPDLNHLPDDLRESLHAALDALLYRRDPGPLNAWLLAHRENADGLWPDGWRHAAARLNGVAPSGVSKRLRFAVKHACYFLLLTPEEAEADVLDHHLLTAHNVVRETLLALGR